MQIQNKSNILTLEVCEKEGGPLKVGDKDGDKVPDAIDLCDDTPTEFLDLVGITGCTGIKKLPTIQAILSQAKAKKTFFNAYSPTPRVTYSNYKNSVSDSFALNQNVRFLCRQMPPTGPFYKIPKRC